MQSTINNGSKISNVIPTKNFAPIVNLPKTNETSKYTEDIIIIQNDNQKSDSSNILSNASTNMSTTPKTSANMSITPNESANMSMTPNESTNMSITPNASANMSMTPNESANMSITPNTSANMSMTPNASANMSITPNTSANMSITPNASANISITPNALTNMSMTANALTNMYASSETSNNHESSDDDDDDDELSSDDVENDVNNGMSFDNLYANTNGTNKYYTFVFPSKNMLLNNGPNDISPLNFNDGISTVSDENRQYVTDGLFYIEFPSAGEFYKVLEYLGGSHNNMTSDSNYFEINEYGLTYTGTDPNKKILNNATINRENLTMFFYQTENNKPYRFHVPANEFKSIIKNCTRDMKLILNKKSGDNNIYIKSGESVKCIEQIRFKGSSSSIPKIYHDKSKPNAVIPVSRLRDICKSINNKIKVLITVRDNSLMITKLNDRGLKCAADVFTSNDPYVARETCEIIKEGFIASTIAKNFGKLHTISPNGTVKVYVRKDKPILFSLQVCYLGNINIYIVLT